MKEHGANQTSGLGRNALTHSHGFIPFAFEWWHYDYVGWEKYPPLDVSFDSLARGAKGAGRTP